MKRAACAVASLVEAHGESATALAVFAFTLAAFLTR